MAKATAKSKATPTAEVSLAPASVVAIADEIEKRLVAVGPTLARLAAADTIHSVERGETVIRHALDEGDVAARLMAERTEANGE